MILGFVVCLIVAIVISCQTIVKEFMLYISTWGVNLLYAISRLTLDVSGCEAETLYQAKLELVSIHTPAWGVKAHLLTHSLYYKKTAVFANG